MDVFPVWHVRHAAFIDGSPTEHRGTEGELLIDEQDGDDVKLLGIFRSEDTAQQRITRARSESGFQDEPDCFIVDRYCLDEDKWVDGFVTMSDEG